MSIWFNEPKDGSKFATFACSDWSTINTTIEFDELRFCQDDEFYYLFCHATKLTDAIKIGEKDWKFTSQLLSFEVAKKQTKRYSSKEKKQIDVDQSLVEKFACNVLAELDESKAYKGFLVLQHSGFLNTVVFGVDANGAAVPDLVLNQLKQTLYQFDETDTELVPVDEVKPKAKKQWSNGARGQTELEKLNDRLSFLATQLKVAYPDLQINSIHELNKVAADKATDKDTDFQGIVDWCLLLIK